MDGCVKCIGLIVCPHFAHLSQISPRALGRASFEICEGVRSLFVRNGVAPYNERVGQGCEMCRSAFTCRAGRQTRCVGSVRCEMNLWIESFGQEGAVRISRCSYDPKRLNDYKVATAETLTGEGYATTGYLPARCAVCLLNMNTISRCPFVTSQKNGVILVDKK